MINQLSWKVGGQQGEGIDSTGEIFALVLNRQGYFLYGYRHFSSRIKGGHTSNKIRVCTKPISAISDYLDVLVAFDQETIDIDSLELREGGVVIADSKFNPKLPEGVKARLYSVPFTAISDKLGSSLMKNMVAVGASSALLGLSLDEFKAVIEEMFSRKGQKVVDNNMSAITQGAEFILAETGGPLPEFQLEKADGKKRLFMIGNDAIAIGALAAGCRFMPAYPITPASEIMEYLIKKLPLYGGTVVQTEDEIAAITMAIGANYAGLRSMTASAGPGLSLMKEAIGLAGMTETPVVIVNTQRGGPSTGLPTKQEQSDLNAMIYSTHGEIPIVVITPGTVEEAFYDTIQAFNIAEELQCPVILLTDLQLSLGKQTVEPLEYDRIEIRRGKFIGDQELPETENGLFKRFEFTEDGISPRVIPGQKNGLHHVTGVEHNEFGSPSERSENRRRMMEKRLNKLKYINFDQPVHIVAPFEQADVLLIGIGSTRGAIEEASERLEADGIKVNRGHVRLVAPFPTDALKSLVDNAKKVIIIENNATGQLTDQIKLHVGSTEKIDHLLKYDGNPFLPSEIYTEIKGMI